MEQHHRQTDELELYVPRLEELWFKQKMESDPATMSYNRGWHLSYPDYYYKRIKSKIGKIPGKGRRLP